MGNRLKESFELLSIALLASLKGGSAHMESGCQQWQRLKPLLLLWPHIRRSLTTLEE